LAKDLKSAFPEMKGFSPRNLKYMRLLAETYADEQFVQQAVAQIPWGHNVRILDKVKDRAQCEFIFAKLSKTAGVETFWNFKSNQIYTNGKAKQSPISPELCPRRNRIWRRTS
jgi:predicted nuclease of restriction endonuclease-like (RecB) superfamily